MLSVSTLTAIGTRSRSSQVASGAVVFEATSRPTVAAMRRRCGSAARHAPGRRAFAVEGTGSYGAGLTRFLLDHDERVLEVGRLRRERRSGGKTDALDAIRAARSVLTQKRPATPRAGGEREALRALMAAREGAVNANGPGSASCATCWSRHPSRCAASCGR